MKFEVFLGWSVGVSGCVDGSKKILQISGFCSALPADLSGQRRGERKGIRTSEHQVAGYQGSRKSGQQEIRASGNQVNRQQDIPND